MAWRCLFLLSLLAGGLEAQTCTFTLAATPQSFPQVGGTGTLRIVASASSCARSLVSNVSWIVIDFGQQGTGDGSAGFTVAPNNDSPMRSGNIMVNGAPGVTITQGGPACTFAINPTSAGISATAQTGSFALTGLGGCTWSAVSTVPWLAVTAPANGTGSATISYMAQANPAAARTGAIQVAGLTFMVNQAGSCAYTLSPASGSYPASGGAGTFSVSSGLNCAWMAAAGASWIHITAGQSGSGLGSVAFTVDANTGGARNGSITAGGQTFTIAEAAAATAPPGIQISADSIANSASYAKGGVSPGLIVTLAAPGVGPAATVAEQLTPDGAFFTTQLAGVRVLFDGVAAPMVYAANGQFSAIVPYEVAGKPSTQLQLEYQGALSNSVALPVIASQPGLFSYDSSGSGPGAILDQQYNLNSAANPAAIGSVVFLFGTGEGQTTPPGVDGKLAVVPLPSPQLPVSVTIGGINAPVLYAGAAPGLVAGLLQVNVQIPDGVPSGAQPVVLTIGQSQSPAGVTVAIQ